MINSVNRGSSIQQNQIQSKISPSPVPIKSTNSSLRQEFSDSGNGVQINTKLPSYSNSGNSGNSLGSGNSSNVSSFNHGNLSLNNNFSNNINNNNNQFNSASLYQYKIPTDFPTQQLPPHPPSHIPKGQDFGSNFIQQQDNTQYEDMKKNIENSKYSKPNQEDCFKQLQSEMETQQLQMEYERLKYENQKLRRDSQKNAEFTSNLIKQNEQIQTQYKNIKRENRALKEQLRDYQARLYYSSQEIKMTENETGLDPQQLRSIYMAMNVNSLDQYQMMMLPPEALAHADPNYINTENMTYQELMALQERIGFVSQGLNQEEIQLIQHISYSQQLKQFGDDCTICCSEFVKDEKLKKLRCSHIYHPPCIDTWLQNQKTCPICKQQAL